jgi:hypothetical protein
MEWPALAADGVEHFDLAAVPPYHSDITRLAPASGIEHCPIEHDASVDPLEDAAFCLGEIGVARGELFCRS